MSLIAVAALPAHPPTRRPAVGTVVSVVALLALATAVVLERTHTYDEPLERDVAAYVVLGHEIRLGRHMYTDLWERKSPLLYNTFSLTERWVGYGRPEVFALNVTAALVTLVGCYAAGRAAGGGGLGGLAAAGLWALLGADLWLEANQPNGEVFVNACLTGAAALLLAWPTRVDRRPRWGRAVAVGALFAGTTLFKHNAAVLCLALAAAHAGVGWRAKRGRPAAVEMAVALGVSAVAWLALAAQLAVAGRLGAAYRVMFVESAGYAGNPITSLANYFFYPEAIRRGLGGWTTGPLLLMVAWAWAGPTGRVTDRWAVWAAWAIGSVLATALPGHLFPHYYQYEIPVACVAGGWATAGLLSRAARRPALLRWAAVAAAFCAAAAYELPHYRLTPQQWCDAKGAGNFVEQSRMGRWLAATLRPGERFWDGGSDVTLYLETRQSPISGLLFPDPLNSGTTAQALAYRDRLTADVTAARPDMVVLQPAEFARLGFHDQPLWRWVGANYVTVRAAVPSCPDFAVCVRRGSDVERRLSATTRAASTSESSTR